MSDSIDTMIEECAAESKALQQIKAAYPYAKRVEGRLVADDLAFDDCNVYEHCKESYEYIWFGRRFGPAFGGAAIVWQNRPKPVSLLCDVLLAKKMRIELARAGW